MTAKVLEFATDRGPVMYIGIPPFEAVTIMAERCIANEALFDSEKFTIITTFA